MCIYVTGELIVFGPRPRFVFCYEDEISKGLDSWFLRIFEHVSGALWLLKTLAKTDIFTYPIQRRNLEPLILQNKI